MPFGGACHRERGMPLHGVDDKVGTKDIGSCISKHKFNNKNKATL